MKCVYMMSDTGIMCYKRDNSVKSHRIALKCDIFAYNSPVIYLIGKYNKMQ